MKDEFSFILYISVEELSSPPLLFSWQVVEIYRNHFLFSAQFGATFPGVWECLQMFNFAPIFLQNVQLTWATWNTALTLTPMKLGERRKISPWMQCASLSLDAKHYGRTCRLNCQEEDCNNNNSIIQFKHWQSGIHTFLQNQLATSNIKYLLM